MTKYSAFFLLLVLLLPSAMAATTSPEKKYPFEMTWADHRPIGMLALASCQPGKSPKNPRCWMNCSDKIDVTTEAGRADFRDQIMQCADACIAHCKDLDAQGIIVWDIEGQEMPHMTSYLADPRMLAQVAPEMEPLADTVFKKFRDAKLRVGVAIRPTRVTGHEHHWRQTGVHDPIAELSDKINYAQKRWGCTIFYIDSNVDVKKNDQGKTEYPPMSADGFVKLAHLHRDCLLLPEHSTPQYWANTAPYHELAQGYSSTPENVRALYPHSFSVLRVVDGPLLEGQVFDKLTDAVKSGDILLFRAWFDDPDSQKVKSIYECAKDPDLMEKLKQKAQEELKKLKLEVEKQEKQQAEEYKKLRQEQKEQDKQQEKVEKQDQVKEEKPN